MSLALLSSSSLVNTDVKNTENQDIGTITDLMIDITHGKIAYAVLSFGGFMGFGDKLFAIPWRALTVDTVDEKFVLNISKDMLEQAEDLIKIIGPICQMFSGITIYMPIMDIHHIGNK